MGSRAVAEKTIRVAMAQSRASQNPTGEEIRANGRSIRVVVDLEESAPSADEAVTRRRPWALPCG